MVAANQLVERCQAEGWGPFLISTIPSLRRRGFYGFVATDFPLWECLLILRPISAAQHTLNLVPWQRACLLLSGAIQSAVWWPVASAVGAAAEGSGLMGAGESPLPARNDFPLSFFEDLDSLRWRYPAEDFKRLAFDREGGDYVIYKKGSPSQYMRVCQWALNATEVRLSRVAQLVQLAQRDGAMGVRWSVYGGENARALVHRLRRFGFLCVRRERILQIKSQEKDFLRPENWNLTDSMFSFHHW
jgi:hypothetical protein